MDPYLQDLRSGFRILTKSPGPAIAAVLVLAIGIGLATAMFSIVFGIVFRGLPFEDGHRIVAVTQTENNDSVPVSDFLDWRAQQTSFEDLAGAYSPSVYISDGEVAERYEGARMSANAFAQLRVRPIHGSLYDGAHDQPGADPVVLLGFHVWRDRYASDPGIVGRSLLVDGIPTTVLGVMPEGFRFPIREDVWLPLKAEPREGDRSQDLYVQVFGRLRDGVTIDDARAEMGLIAQRLEEAYPETNAGLGAIIKTFTRQTMGESRHGLGYTCLGAVAFVLLIACSNVANLLLARTSSRSRELAVRTALGASRGRVISQVMAESFVLSVPAAAVGLLLAAWGVQEFNQAVAGQDWPYWFDVRINVTSLFVVLALATVSTLASGLAPALRASRLDVHAVLKNESRGSGLNLGRLSKNLVILEVALSCVLLVGAGLMVRSILNLAEIDFAFETDNVFTARMGLPSATYEDDESRLRFWETLHEELRATPGITHVALADAFPGADFSQAVWYGNAEKAYASDEEYTWVRRASVTPGFFATFNVPVDGRDFNSHDDASNEPVVIINRSLAQREWPGENPLGKRMRFGRSDSERPWLTVVGVVSDLHMDGLRNQHRAGVYVPLAQAPRTHMGIVARTVGEPLSVTEAVRERTRMLDASLPVYFVDSLEGLLGESKFFYHLIGTMFSILGMAALALATVGLYGVLAFSMSRRIAEVGIRMALGAVTRDVLRLVLGLGFRQVAVGLILGLLAAMGTAQLMSSQLYRVEALDPLTFAAIAALMIGVGLAASLVPAIRALRVDPVHALRYE